METARALPSSGDLSKASALEVVDINGTKVKFGDLVNSKKTIVVFIRHFFCNACQAYVAQLSKIDSKALEDAHTQIIVIGCGDWQPIPTYKEITNFSGAMYADPSRALFRALGMNIEKMTGTPKGETKKSYLQPWGAAKTVILGLWNGPFKMPWLIGKHGNVAQLGGEFIFEEGGACTFASRMQHTEDHFEVADLMKEAGIQYP